MLVTTLARDLYNSIATDRDPDPGTDSVRRRWIVGLFLVIDRFVPNWAAQAFGSPPALAIDLLRQAVGPPSPEAAAKS